MSVNTVSQLYLLDTKSTRKRSSVTLKFKGDISYENCGRVIEQISATLIRQPKKIVMNFIGVEMIDSSGLRALLQGRKLCENAGTGFELTGISDCVSRIIAMSGLSRIFGLPAVDSRPCISSNSGAIDLPETGWDTYECVVTSDASLISSLREKIINAAAEAGADGDTLCDIQIAVGEALTNAYRHGSPDKGKNKISLRCMTCRKAIIVDIQDEGNPFDPNSIDIPDPNKLRDHGMGIYLMRTAMDVVEFSSNCPGNRVRMIKRLCECDDGAGQLLS